MYVGGQTNGKHKLLNVCRCHFSKLNNSWGYSSNEMGGVLCFKHILVLSQWSQGFSSLPFLTFQNEESGNYTSLPPWCELKTDKAWKLSEASSRLLEPGCIYVQAHTSRTFQFRKQMIYKNAWGGESGQRGLFFLFQNTGTQGHPVKPMSSRFRQTKGNSSSYSQGLRSRIHCQVI